MDMLEKVKLFLGITTNEKDQLLNEIISSVEERIKIKIGKDEIPKNLDFIIYEIAIVRYNRIGSEGMQSEIVDGHRMNFVEDDFKPYEPFLESFNKENSKGWEEGSAYFL